MTPNVTYIYFELSQAGEKKKKPTLSGKLSAYQRGELPHSASERCTAPLEGIKLFRTPARKTILTLKNTLATLCLVKGYINSSFKKDKTISMQSKQIHL